MCVFLVSAILPSPKSHSHESAFLALHCFSVMPGQSEKSSRSAELTDKQEINYTDNELYRCRLSKPAKTWTGFFLLKWPTTNTVVTSFFFQDFCHVEVKALLLPALSHILLGSSASPLFFIYFSLNPWSSSWPKISKVAQHVSPVN